MKTLIAASVLLMCSISNALTPNEMLETMQENVQMSYVGKKCEFTYRGEGNDAGDAFGPVAFGGFIYTTLGRKLLLNQRAMNASTKQFVYMVYRYGEIDGHLYQNLVGNGIVMPVAPTKMEQKIIGLKVISPWDVECAFAGTGLIPISLHTDDRVQLKIIKETPDEIVIDEFWGEIRTMSFHLDPKMNYCLKRLVSLQNGDVLFDRTFDYEDGLVSKVTMLLNGKRSEMAFQWSNVTEADVVSLEALSDVGDSVIKVEKDNTKKAYRRTEGGLVVDNNMEVPQ